MSKVRLIITVDYDPNIDFYRQFYNELSLENLAKYEQKDLEDPDAIGRIGDIIGENRYTVSVVPVPVPFERK